jgi:DNA-binding MarR family transcriptional regulator
MYKPEVDQGAARASALAAELRNVIGKLKRRFRVQGQMGDLTMSQVAVLSRLERDGPATVTSLAKAEGMRPQSMSANISALEAAGLVGGAPDPNDGRQTILSVTPAFIDWIKARRAAREDWLLRALQTHFTETEQDELARAAVLLKRLVDL